MRIQVSSSAQFLFDRAWAITISPPAQGDKPDMSNPQVFNEGQQYTNSLRVTFDIEKTSDSTPNKAKIDVYNLNTQSRIKYKDKGQLIKLVAGYKGLTEILFLGITARTLTRREGADIVTSFEAGDGEQNIANYYFQKSYEAGTKYTAIINDLVTALKIEKGNISLLDDKVLQKGLPFSGSIKSLLDLLTNNLEYTWSIQNNHIQINSLKATNGEPSIFLSSETGLIGEPSLKESGVIFEALLNPRLIPECAVELKSNTINGYFKLKNVKYKGDTHGNEWKAVCEGVAVEAGQINQGAGQAYTQPGIGIV